MATVTATPTDQTCYTDPADSYQAACANRKTAALARLERVISEARPKPASSAGLHHTIGFLRADAYHASEGDEEAAARLLIRAIVSYGFPFVNAMVANTAGPLRVTRQRLATIGQELSHLSTLLASNKIDVTEYERSRDNLTRERDHLSARADERQRFLDRWPTAIKDEATKAVDAYPGQAAELAHDLAAVLADSEPPRPPTEAERELAAVEARLANVDKASRLGGSLARATRRRASQIATDAANRAAFHAANAKTLVNQLLAGDADAFITLERLVHERPDGFTEDWLETLQTRLEEAVCAAGARVALEAICPT